jgi:hypothetical protein
MPILIVRSPKASESRTLFSKNALSHGQALATNHQPFHTTGLATDVTPTNLFPSIGCVAPFFLSRSAPARQRPEYSITRCGIPRTPETPVREETPFSITHFIHTTTLLLYIHTIHTHTS